MNHARERAYAREREQKKALTLIGPAERKPRQGYGEDAYPDPPGNDEFDKYDESFQLVVEAKFARGVMLTGLRNAKAREAAAKASAEWGARIERRKLEARRVAQLHLDRLTNEQRQYRKSRSEVLEHARRKVRT